MTATVKLSEAPTRAFQVAVLILGDTSELFDDVQYVSRPGGQWNTLGRSVGFSIWVNAGSTTATLPLRALQDADNDDETFIVSLYLSEVPPKTLGTPSSALVTIVDDERSRPAPALWTVQEFDGRLNVVWGVASAADYDVHYTSASASAVANDAAVTAGAASAGWVDARYTGGVATDARYQYVNHSIGGLANGTEYRVRVRASYGGIIDATPWAFGKGTPAVQLRRLVPDPNLLTGLTVHDGTRELPLDPSSANRVGFGGPHIRYWVHVNPGVDSLTVTPTWTNPSITGVTGTTYYYVPFGRYGANVTWSASGVGETVPLVVPNLSFQGVTRVRLTLGGVTSQSYDITFAHNFKWKSANERLRRMTMGLR